MPEKATRRNANARSTSPETIAAVQPYSYAFSRTLQQVQSPGLNGYELLFCY